MNPESHVFGQTAESLAARHLREKGYRIIGRNVRLPGGELDLIARDGNTLVFVEVKARRSDSHGGALAALTSSKQKRIMKLAAQYLAKHQISQQSCRFDVVLCHHQPDHSPELTHIENAFEISGEDLRW